MNILSLFDGISCAKIALEKLHIPISNYYSSEIDKYALQVSSLNNPQIIQLGDIKGIKVSELPKIDLLIGGSPCQDLSNAQKGLGLEGMKSSLFYEYIKILKELEPKYFLLENVKNKWGITMNKYLGVDFIEINSSFFSAQSRPRYYWTNIKFSKTPSKYHKEVIKDIICSNVDKKYYYVKNDLDQFISNHHTKINSDNVTNDGILKLFDIPKNIINDHERQRRVYSLKSKSPTILARSDTTKILDNNGVRKLTPLECERLQKIPDNYTSCCSDTQRYKMIGNAFNIDTVAHILKGLKKSSIKNKVKN